LHPRSLAIFLFPREIAPFPRTIVPYAADITSPFENRTYFPIIGKGIPSTSQKTVPHAEMLT
jgi:hypothetical protein